MRIKELQKPIIMNNTDINNFLKGLEVVHFIKNDKLMMSYTFDDCPMYVVKEDIGVEFYLQYKEERDYSNIKEFISFAKPRLEEMLEEERNRVLYQLYEASYILYRFPL